MPSGTKFKPNIAALVREVRSEGSRKRVETPFGGGQELNDLRSERSPEGPLELSSSLVRSSDGISKDRIALVLEHDSHFTVGQL